MKEEILKRVMSIGITLVILGVLLVGFGLYEAEVRQWYYRNFMPDVAILQEKVDSLEKVNEIWRSSLSELNKDYDRMLDIYDQELKTTKLEKEALRKQLTEELAKVWGQRELVDFGDMKVLMRFLAEDDTDQMEYVGVPPAEYVCSHYSFQLMRNAADRGYRLYPVVVISMQGYKVVGMHMMTFAVVNRCVPQLGKEDKFIVFIEPMTDEITLFGRLHDKSSWISQFYKFLP